MCSYGGYQGILNATQVPFLDKRRSNTEKKVCILVIIEMQKESEITNSGIVKKMMK